MSLARSRSPRTLRRSSRKPSPPSPVSTPPAGDGDPLRLRESIAEVTDEDGTPRAGQLDRALALLESWTQWLEAERAGGLVDSAENERYRKFTEALIRLTRRDGSIVLRNGHPHDDQPHSSVRREVWSNAARLVEPRLRKLVNGVLRGGTLGPASSKRGSLPPPSANSEEAGLAVLRPTWSSPRLAVDYHGSQLRLALDCGSEMLVCGECNPRLTIDGTPLAPLSRWESLCWVTDDDVDYLELELALTGDVRVQRHLVFAREDQFLFMADAVLGGPPRVIDYQLALPLAENVSAECGDQTRETALVKGGRRRATVLPLGLGEWKEDRRRGELRAQSGLVELRQSAAGAGNLFAPWFVDLEPRRFSRPVTWRQLSVAEDRQIQPDDAAVGYRVQVGARQWLFYRSLIACGNRTLLGHNLVSEFLAARFSRRGVPETLIEIEAPADENE
jgi:hypothetical protein